MLSMPRNLFAGEEQRVLLINGSPVGDIALASQTLWHQKKVHCIPLLLVPSPESNEYQMASRVLDGATGLKHSQLLFFPLLTTENILPEAVPILP